MFGLTARVHASLMFTEEEEEGRGRGGGGQLARITRPRGISGSAASIPAEVQAAVALVHVMLRAQTWTLGG